MRAQFKVSPARLGLKALEKVVQDVTEHPQLLAAAHSVFRTAHPECSNSVGQKQFSVPALGVVVRMNPNSTVLPHPRDQFLVLDADFVGECLDFMDQRYGVSDQTKRLASVGGSATRQ